MDDLPGLLKSIRKIQEDAKVYGLAGYANLRGVKCRIEELTLGHMYNLGDSMDRVTIIKN